jgi:hypothetical protein
VFFIAFFIFGPFIKFLYVFNLVFQLQFIIYYFFQFGPYSFDFWFFFLGSFLKVQLVFNFILQSKFMLFYYFQFIPHSFDFFLVVKVFSFKINSPI